jgi:hypothetical protein
MAERRMTMRTIIAIACLGLLLWVEPAGAQKTYSLTVSRHPDVALSAADVDKILADASKMLQKTSARTSSPNNVACNVASRTEVLTDGQIQKTRTFNIASITHVVVEMDGTTDGAVDNFVVSEEIRFATA